MGLPADAVASLALEAVGQSGAGALPEGLRTVATSTPVRFSDPHWTPGQPRLSATYAEPEEGARAVQQPIEIEVDEHEQILERVAGIDVAKATGMVCTRVPHDTVAGRRVTKVWEVKTTTRALLELADHLRCQSIQRIVLESTSDYWRPFFYILEAAGLSVWLVNAAQVKNVPGRPKTDKIDAVWLAKLAEKSMVSPSFVPAEPMRHVRALARARFDLVEDRARVKQRVEKLLEDALIKISSVLTDIHGVTGRAIIESLIAGQRNPKVLAELAKGRARARRADLEAACDGRFTDHHARLAKMLLSQIDDLGARIEEVTTLLDEAIAALPAPAPASTDSTTAGTGTGTAVPLDTGPARYASAVDRLCQIPGAGPDSVRAVLGESGSPGALPHRGPLRTVRAPHRRTRLKQAPRALRVEAPASCVGGRAARGGRRRGSSGFGSHPSCRPRRGGRGVRRRSPCAPRPATSAPIPEGTGANAT